MKESIINITSSLAVVAIILSISKFLFGESFNFVEAAILYYILARNYNKK